MLIPRHYRKQLKAIDYRKWFWRRIWDWAYGERYKFRDGSIAYVKRGDIVSIRYGGYTIWMKTDV